MRTGNQGDCDDTSAGAGAGGVNLCLTLSGVLPKLAPHQQFGRCRCWATGTAMSFGGDGVNILFVEEEVIVR